HPAAIRAGEADRAAACGPPVERGERSARVAVCSRRTGPCRGRSAGADPRHDRACGRAGARAAAARTARARTAHAHHRPRRVPARAVAREPVTTAAGLAAVTAVMKDLLINGLIDNDANSVV